MATRLYLHNALSGVSGTLPSAEQSTNTATINYDAQTVNRSMNTTIGTSQASLSFTNSNSRSNVFGYVTKFVSDSLSSTSIAANTWTWNFAANCNGSFVQNFPTPSSGTTVPVCCYVWRPSTGAKVQNIFDGNASNTYFNANDNPSSIRSEHGTFSGAAVTTQANDVIVVEMWIRINTVTGTATPLLVYYDGTTVTQSSGTTVSSHASFLETPENLSFGGGGGPIDMTESAAKTYSNKFITKV